MRYLTLCSAALLTISSEALLAQGKGLRVAVYPFEVQGTAAARGWNPVVDFGKHASQAAQTPLVRIAGVSVMTRDRLEQIAKEQGVRFDERFDRSKTPAFGKLVGVQAIVTGSIESISASEERLSTSVSQTGGTEEVKRSAQVVLVMNAFSTESGELLFSERASSDTSLKVSGSAVIENRVVGTLKGCFKNPTSCAGGRKIYTKVPIAAADADALVSATISSALEKVSQKFSEKLPAVIAKAPAAAAEATPTELLPPQIVGEAEGEFVLNRGEEAGLSEGDTLQVQRLDAPIQVGGKTIQPTTVIGVVHITSVGEGWAKGEYRPKRATSPKRPVQAKVGDHIKLPSSKQVSVYVGDMSTSAGS